MRVLHSSLFFGHLPTDSYFSVQHRVMIQAESVWSKTEVAGSVVKNNSISLSVLQTSVTLHHNAGAVFLKDTCKSIVCPQPIRNANNKMSLAKNHYSLKK